MTADGSRDAGARARRLYAPESLLDRAHVLGRWRSCPFPAVEAHTPPAGAVLDVGCGFGLFSSYLALSQPKRRVHGIDIDERKIALARRAAARAGDEVDLTFSVTDGDLPDGPFDAIAIVDVLYLLGPTAGAALVDQAIERLAPGGVLLVKEIDVRPAWKYRLSRVQELLATRVFRFTAGAEVDFAPPEHYAERMRQAGLDVRTLPLDRGSLHPHVLLTGTAP